VETDGVLLPGGLFWITWCSVSCQLIANCQLWTQQLSIGEVVWQTGRLHVMRLWSDTHPVCWQCHVLLYVHGLKQVKQTHCSDNRWILNMHIEITASNNRASVHYYDGQLFKKCTRHMAGTQVINRCKQPWCTTCRESSAKCLICLWWRYFYSSTLRDSTIQNGCTSIAWLRLTDSINNIEVRLHCLTQPDVVTSAVPCLCQHEYVEASSSNHLANCIYFIHQRSNIQPSSITGFSFCWQVKLKLATQLIAWHAVVTTSRDGSLAWPRDWSSSVTYVNLAVTSMWRSPVA